MSIPPFLGPTAKVAIYNISQFETNEDAEKASDLFVKTYGKRYHKANVYLSKYMEEIRLSSTYDTLFARHSYHLSIKTHFAIIHYSTKHLTEV